MTGKKALRRCRESALVAAVAAAAVLALHGEHDLTLAGGGSYVFVKNVTRRSSNVAIVDLGMLWCMTMNGCCRCRLREVGRRH